MPDEKRININISMLFPEAARRVKILDDLKRSWPAIVGAVTARHSFPYNLGVNEICVSAENNEAAVMLNRMKGNITRALVSRYGYDSGEKIDVKIITGLPKKKYKPEVKHAGKNTASEIKIDNEAVKLYMSNAPESLPENINYALSHLRAFLEKRFAQKK